jgi:melibiose permease
MECYVRDYKGVWGMEKLSAKAKYSFGVGAIGKDAVVNLVGIYLMFYITDVLGLSPAFVGTLFFIARIWYATNDPVMGMIVDNTHSRFGKFRPWIVIGTLVNSVIFVLLFTNFGLSTTELYVYISIAYLLYGMTYTIMDIPYWSWLPSLTIDQQEREEVSVIPRFFASLAGMLIGTFGLYMIDFFDRSFGGSGDRQTGFTVSAIVIAIIFIGTIAVTVFNVPEKPTNRNAPRIKFKQIGKLLAKNDQLVAFIGILLSFQLYDYSRNALPASLSKACENIQSYQSVYTRMQSCWNRTRHHFSWRIHCTAKSSIHYCRQLSFEIWFRSFPRDYNSVNCRCD